MDLLEGPPLSPPTPVYGCRQYSTCRLETKSKLEKGGGGPLSPLAHGIGGGKLVPSRDDIREREKEALLPR